MQGHNSVHQRKGEGGDSEVIEEVYEYQQARVDTEWDLFVTCNNFGREGWRLVHYALEPFDEEAGCYYWLAMFERVVLMPTGER
jgi:hypothetical protein